MIGTNPMAVADWYGTVYNIAFAVARRDFRFTRADAEDVAQEMSVRALRQITIGAINRSWVHRGATFLCIDMTRSREYERRALEVFVSDPTVRMAWSRAELDPDVSLAISHLSPVCQELIHRYFREGRTWREIDLLLGRGRRCSRYATSKCLEHLQQLLAHTPAAQERA